MSVKAGYATPLWQVAVIEASLRFCELLGFVTIDTDRWQPLDWARLDCEDGALLFVRVEHPVDASVQAGRYLRQSNLLAATFLRGASIQLVIGLAFQRCQNEFEKWVGRCRGLLAVLRRR